MDLSIVIVSYRAKHFLEQTLQAALQALQGFAGEIIVVDNASGDDTVQWTRHRVPEGSVTWIENHDNVGFARANNQAIARARGKYTVILNPDTIITRQCLASCVEWMDSHPKCGAIGLHMVDGNGVFLPESKRALPTPWVSFCKLFGLSALFPKSRRFARYHLRFLPEDQPHPIEILSGAYMFCNTQALQQLGGFDEDFWMYGEDIDLSYRFVKAGYENWYLPTTMVHYKGESTKKDSVRYVRVFYDAMLIFYRKHFARYGRLMSPFIHAGVWLRQSITLLRNTLRHSHSEPQHNWVIVSDQPAAVAKQAGIGHYATQVPEQAAAADVLIDDSCHTYAQIVDMLAANTRPNVRYHIYAARNGMVITPKMK